MKRASIALPEDLAQAVENYVQSHEVPPSLSTLMQAALRQYLGERVFPGARKTLQITAARRGSGHHGVSREHDLYLAGLPK